MPIGEVSKKKPHKGVISTTHHFESHPLAAVFHHENGVGCILATFSFGQRFMSKPKSIGVVSLGCPKALVDSEQILTRLRAEGYLISPSYEGADLVIVNTCGFIDAAVEESLDAIGEALTANGKVIVTGCLGSREEMIRQAHPKVLAVTGPHTSDEVLQQVHTHLPQPHDPFTSLVPPQGIKLTPPAFCLPEDFRGL
jgi:tRNA A37 methylthiotransferase MiaB